MDLVAVGSRDIEVNGFCSAFLYLAARDHLAGRGDPCTRIVCMVTHNIHTSTQQRRRPRDGWETESFTCPWAYIKREGIKYTALSCFSFDPLTHTRPVNGQSFNSFQITSPLRPSLSDRETFCPDHSFLDASGSRLTGEKPITNRNRSRSGTWLSL